MTQIIKISRQETGIAHIGGRYVLVNSTHVGDATDYVLPDGYSVKDGEIYDREGGYVALVDAGYATLRPALSSIETNVPGCVLFEARDDRP